MDHQKMERVLWPTNGLGYLLHVCERNFKEFSIHRSRLFRMYIKVWLETIEEESLC